LLQYRHTTAFSATSAPPAETTKPLKLALQRLCNQ
jgi:hypothetical protein